MEFCFQFIMRSLQSSVFLLCSYFDLKLKLFEVKRGFPQVQKNCLFRLIKDYGALL